MDLLSYKNITFKKLENIWPELKAIEADVKEQIEIESVYYTYFLRQRSDIEDFKREEGLKIPKTQILKRLAAYQMKLLKNYQILNPHAWCGFKNFWGDSAALISIMRF